MDHTRGLLLPSGEIVPLEVGRITQALDLLDAVPRQQSDEAEREQYRPDGNDCRQIRG